MANFNFTLKRGVSGEDTLFPQTTWTQVLNKPTTFTPTAHEHTKADITDFLPTIDTKTANYTLAATDSGKVLRVNSASTVTITIPTNSIVPIPINTEIAIIRYGTGIVRIIPVGVTVTLRSYSNYTRIKDQYTSAALKKIDTNEWILVGNLGA